MFLLFIFILACNPIATGTEVIIHNADEFFEFAKSHEIGITVILESDLDFTGIQFYPTIDFIGTFNGQGHVISNLIIESTSKYIGFLGDAYGPSFYYPTYIKNIIIDDSCSFTGNGDTNYIRSIGSIIGACYAVDSVCEVLNSVNLASVTFSGSANERVYLGGITGLLSSGDYAPFVRNCVNYGSVTFSGSSTNLIYISGISGIGSFARIQNTYSYGTIMYTGTSESEVDIGGLSGFNKYGIFENCVSAGLIKISGTGKTKYVGALVGDANYHQDIQNCYWDANIAYDAYGHRGFLGIEPVYCAKYNNNFVLNQTVIAGTYTGTSLIDALNAVTFLPERNYSNWMLNSKKLAVKFTINNSRSFYEESQLMLLPSLESGDNKKFEGWYTDRACTTLLTNFKGNTYTQLYGNYN